MEFMTGAVKKETLEIHTFLEEDVRGKHVKVNGAVHTIRDMGTVVFVILRKREGLLQCVLDGGKAELERLSLKEAQTVEVEGEVRAEDRAPNGFELRVTAAVVLSEPAEPMPFAVSKQKLSASLEANLNNRAVTLRNVRERAKFRIQEGIVRSFRDFLYQEGFTEIHTPKIGAKSAEGGANLFRLEYFHRPAVLQQSPQFYKQMMVGVFDRVFETAPVFRAEKHNTKRHLNEYTSLDFEMSFIDGFLDIMAMEIGFLQYMVRLLQTEYEKECRILGIKMPKIGKIPVVRFDEAKQRAAKKYGRAFRNPYDLEPEDTRYTLSFDLLFHGLEITTGGQRIHDYAMLLEKMERRGVTQEGMEQYLAAFKYGMPPHGGLGIGLERLTMQLVGAENVRETTLFPRDVSRLEP